MTKATIIETAAPAVAGAKAARGGGTGRTATGSKDSAKVRRTAATRAGNRHGLDDARRASSSTSAGGQPAAKARVATPWGRATLVERLSVPQRSGDRRFASSIELLEGAGGERLVRIAYSTVGARSTGARGPGTVRRGPVTLRLGDLARLREASRRSPELAAALGWAGRPDAAGDA